MALLGGLSSTGFTKPRAADFLAELKAAFLSELAARGLPTDIDIERDVFFGPLFVALSAALGESADIDQAVYDAWDPNNATGIQLDNIAQLLGLTRQAATKSTAAATLGGTAGTAIPAGSLVAGGGLDGLARWVLSADATIGAGGSVDATVEAEVAGAIEALAGEISTIVTPITGWVSVTNAAAATPGIDDEADADLRRRRAASLQVQGSSSLAAIRAALLELAYIEAAVVIDNDTPRTVISGGIVLNPHAVAVVVYPEPTTDARKAEVVQAIWRHVAGIKTMGAVTATVTATDGVAKTIRYSVATALPVTVGLQVVLEAGYALGDVDAVIEAGVSAHIAALGVGDALYDLDIYALVAAIEGVQRVTSLSLSGGSSVVPLVTERLTHSATTVTT